MPKPGNRLFLNLCRAFGIVGEGDVLGFPLGQTISPILNVNEYDPPPLYGATIASPIVAGQFSFVEIEANPYLRLVCLATGAVNFSTRNELTPGGTPIVVSPVTVPFRSHRYLPQARIQFGSGALDAGAPSVGLLFGFPPNNPLPVIRQVLRIQANTVATALPASLFWDEPATPQ